MLEENKAMVRRMVEGINARDIDDCGLPRMHHAGKWVNRRSLGALGFAGWHHA